MHGRAGCQVCQLGRSQEGKLARGTTLAAASGPVSKRLADVSDLVETPRMAIIQGELTTKVEMPFHAGPAFPVFTKSPHRRGATCHATKCTTTLLKPLAIRQWFASTGSFRQVRPRCLRSSSSFNRLTA